MKKFFAIAMTALMAVLVLVGCGSTESEVAADPAKVYNLADIVTAVEQANPVSNPREADDNLVNLDMLLTADNIAEYAGKVSNDQDNSALILAVKAVEGKAAEVKTEMEAYKTSISTGGMYAEFANKEEMAKDARIVAKGDYVVMVVANTKGASYADIDKALDEALK